MLLVLRHVRTYTVSFFFFSKSKLTAFSFFYFQLFIDLFLFQKISVTTFQSAHDTNSDNAISKFYWLNEKKDNAWDPLDKYSGMCSTKRLLKKCGCRIDRDDGK